MPPAGLEQAAVHFLQQRGFSAELVEEAENVSPDIMAADSEGQKYALEIKLRAVPWVQHAERTSTRLGSDVRVRTDPTGGSNAISRVIKKAASQLDSAGVENEILRLLWFLVDPTDRRYHYERIRHTIYGIKIVVAVRDGEPVSREGIYVAPAEFCRWRNSIDGVLLGTFTTLFLNDLSPRYFRLRSSQLAQQCHAVFDPRRAAEAGDCYYLAPDGSSPTPKNAASRLERTYGIEVKEFINLHRFSAGGAV